MTSLEANPSAAGVPPATFPLAPTRWTKWSDRLNPILVREVQQAVKGRVFTLTVWVALLITVVIAVATANSFDARGGAGRDAFNAGMATLMPLVLFVVPMQAYQSMRIELRGGIVEQLLLSRLLPMRILYGKLLAAMVQFTLYVSVLAPLLATSYLLRGVDLPTIVVSLVFALIGCITATAFAVSSAAQAVLPALQAIANLATAFGLGLASFLFVGAAVSGQYSAMVSYLVREPEFAMVMVAILLLAGTVVTLSLLVAQSFLLHAFENKSTGFRILLFTLPVLAFGWVLAFAGPSARDEFTAALTMVLLVTGIVFAVFMVTEQGELSPRMRAHVPTRAGLALLAAPFLPGRDRGLLCFLGYLVWLAGLAWFCWSGTTRRQWIAEMMGIAALTAVYAIGWLAFGRWLRGRLPAGLQGNHLGRFLLPMSFLLVLLLPVLVDLFLRGEVHNWHYGHVLNPFWTIEQVDRMNTWQEAWLPAAIVTGVLLLLHARVLVGAVREVVAAGAALAQRRRSAP